GGAGRRGRTRAPPSAVPRAAACAARLRLRPYQQAAPLHRQGATRRRPARRARGRVALHSRRLRLLLMARRIVFITQQVDPRHPVLAATVPKIAALAALVDEAVVLA